MNFKRVFFILNFLFITTISGFAQYLTKDTVKIHKTNSLHLAQFILPGALISYGLISLTSDPVRNLDYQIRDNIIGSISYKLDDYLIYAPLAIDIGLSASGIKSRHNIRDKAVIYALSTALNAAMVYPVKSFVARLRPDESDAKSFPSGHTSNAFVGAEYFWQEYKHKSKWLASAGYLMAGTTGYFRVRNNKHWFSDVVAGAGFGILSTKLIYILYPKLSSKIFSDNSKFVVIPLHFDSGYGLGLHIFLE